MVSVLKISGMIAVHSKRAVFTALAGVPGVSSAQVELGRVVLEHDERVTDAAIAAAIESVGYHATSIERVSRRSLPVQSVRADAD